MSIEEIHVGDINTTWQVTVQEESTFVNISGVTTNNFIFTKPDGTRVVKAGTLVNNGSAGVTKYQATSGFINQAGVWKYQIHLVFTDASSYRTDIGTFRVYDNL